MLIKVNLIFFVSFFVWQFLFLYSFFSSKPSYSDAVLAYLALYPFFYFFYIVVDAVKESDNEVVNFVGSQIALFPMLQSIWLPSALRTAEWWRDWHSWFMYFGVAAFLFLFAVYDFKWASKVDYRRAVDALTPLAVFHPIYAIAAIIFDVVVGVDVYRVLLWYFAIYPAALAAVAAGGGRLAVLTALAVYLTAYALGTEKLLLLLVAIPVARHLGLHKLLQSLRGA